MLELLFDRRSGTRPEIVVPVFNEGRRIGNLLSYYAGDFDLVLLDGGSTDDTVDIVREAGATAFRRCGPEWVGENHFVHYVNHVSTSGRCFYLFADELADRDELVSLMMKLEDGDSAILGQRVDWFYGTKARFAMQATLRGVTRGHARYDPGNLHNSLTLDPAITNRFAMPIHHFHLWTMSRYFGQAGAYAHTETEQHLRSARPRWRFLRRFVVSELLLLPRGLWRMRGASMGLFAWRVVMGFVISLIGLLCWIELKYLKSPEQQLDLYRRMYPPAADR